MQEQKPKLPQAGGSRKAAEIFEKTRKKQPSDGLVKIISEIPEKEADIKPKIDRAAKDVEL